MSTDIYIAVVEDGPERTTIDFAYRCDYARRWNAACEAAYAADEPYPDEFSCDDCTDTSINMSSINAYALLQWLGVEDDDARPVDARWLAERCRARLAQLDRGAHPLDYASLPWILARHGEEYLIARTRQVLRMCEKAGDRPINWA